MERTEKITRVEKPWGYELHWAKTAKYVGKIIHVIFLSADFRSPKIVQK